MRCRFASGHRLVALIAMASWFIRLRKARPPDQLGGFHQGARGVAQQHPVHREMDVRLQAGAVEEHHRRVHRHGQAQGLRRVRPGRRHRLGDEPVVQRGQQVCADPFAEPLQRAFGRHLHPVQLSDPQEPLQQTALRAAHRELAETQAGDRPGDIAAQRQSRGPRKALEGFGVGSRQLSGVRGPRRREEGGVKAPVGEHGVNLHELVAELAELHRAKNARKSWTQGRLVGEDVGGSDGCFFLHTKNIPPGFGAWHGFYRAMPLLVYAIMHCIPITYIIWDRLYLEPVPKTRYLKSGKLKNSGFAARLPFSSTFCRGVSFPSGFSHGNTIKVLPPPMGVRPVPSAGQFS